MATVKYSNTWRLKYADDVSSYQSHAHTRRTHTAATGLTLSLSSGKTNVTMSTDAKYRYPRPILENLTKMSTAVYRSMQKNEIHSGINRVRRWTMTASRTTVTVSLSQCHSDSVSVTVSVTRTQVGVTSVRIIENQRRTGYGTQNAHMAFFKRLIRMGRVRAFAKSPLFRNVSAAIIVNMMHSLVVAITCGPIRWISG